MKLLTDCKVTLTIKGLGDRQGEAAIRLNRNDGTDVMLTATRENPEVKMDSVLFIGQEMGEFWQFDLPGAQPDQKASFAQDDRLEHLEVDVIVIFDPAADENRVKVLDTQVNATAIYSGTKLDEFCYTECHNMSICAPVPGCLICDAIYTYCRPQ